MKLQGCSLPGGNCHIGEVEADLRPAYSYAYRDFVEDNQAGAAFLNWLAFPPLEVFVRLSDGRPRAPLSWFAADVSSAALVCECRTHNLNTHRRSTAILSCTSSSRCTTGPCIIWSKKASTSGQHSCSFLLLYGNSSFRLGT